AASWESDGAGEIYERSRSGYPPALIDVLAGEVGLGPLSVVGDVAAGTGKLTRLLLPVVAAVVAIEPAEGMRRQLRRAAPGARAVAATAEHLPLADGVLDAVTVAQAFHWFRPTEALAEFARVVRPGGALALIWNLDDPVLDAGPEAPPNAVSVELKATCDRFERLRPRPRVQWRRSLEGAEGWGPPHEVRLDGSETLTVEMLVDRVASRSFALLLDDPDRMALLAEIERIGRRAAAPDGRVTLPTATVMFWMRRL
ncbi:MAG TPA: class I SAM-dependent methyltransferase, partial [Acidimicrobiales bacterium]